MAELRGDWDLCEGGASLALRKRENRRPALCGPRQQAFCCLGPTGCHRDEDAGQAASKQACAAGAVKRIDLKDMDFTTGGMFERGVPGMCQELAQ
ncbi:MAG: hypothetical protein ACLQU1_12680 [Bryobacteraceae bacterium]